MRDLILLAIHLLVTLAKLGRAGGARAVIAESLLLKHQLLIINRSRQRAPNLTTADRFVIGLTSLFVRPHRVPKLSAILKPATLLKFHKALIDRKYRLLFSSSAPCRKPGPKGPPPELIAAIVEMKRRNPTFGNFRIAQQISHDFGVNIDKDVVRRVLASHYWPGDSGTYGPSWLAVIGHLKDSLWGLICSVSNQSCCAATGSCWSWTSLVAESSALAWSLQISMASVSAECSIALPPVSPNRNV